MAARSSATRILPSMNGPDPVWTSILDSLESECGARDLRTLVENSRFMRRDRDLLRAAIHDGVVSDWQRCGRLQTLCEAVERTGEGLHLAVTPVRRDELEHDAPHCRLDDVVANDGNRDAYAHVVGDHRGASLLVGPGGSGKTHLLLGLAQRAARRLRVLFVPAERLTLCLVHAVQERRLDEVREQLREPELLLVDGLEGLAGRPGSQNELDAAVRHQLQQGGRVVLASRHGPESLGRLRPELRRSLEGARGFRMRPPAPQARIEILRQRIERWRVRALPEAASWLASELGGQITDPDALLTRVLAHPTCRDGIVDLERHQREIGAPPTDAIRDSLPPGAILDQVCRHFNVRLADLLGTSRGPRVTRPRQIAMYLLRHRSRLSYPEIGQRLRRHHTTALHACRRIAARRGDDANLAAALELLEKELDQHPAEHRV
jgi:chromosomal replication initiator protein